MTRVATVLYEDKMQVGAQGSFPPHDFVLAMVRDLTGLELHRLQKQVEKNPRNGVSKLIRDLGSTSQIAGAGTLFVLVDRDRVAEHLSLVRNAPDAKVIAALRAKSDAPDKLSVHFLDPNMEGLMRSIAECAPTERAPQTKAHNDRDIYLKRAATGLPPSVRDCVKAKQPSLAAMVAQLAELCRSAGG